MNFCAGILNFELGMMLGQNLWVFIVFSTVTPSVRERQGCPKTHLQKNVPNNAFCQEILKMSIFSGCIVCIVLQGVRECRFFNFSVYIYKVIDEKR